MRHQFPRVRFVVTGLRWSSKRVVKFSKWSRHGRAVDHGGTNAPKWTTAILPPVPGQPGAAPSLASATQRDRENLARFDISTSKFFGVLVANMKVLAKDLGRDHELAAALWDSGWYEARMVASLVDEPARVTAVQMDRWCRDFDNWAICDTACFALFDRTPHAWRKVAQWSRRRDEFGKRAAFALLWGLTVHDRRAADEPFLQVLLLGERANVARCKPWAARAATGIVRLGSATRPRIGSPIRATACFPVPNSWSHSPWRQRYAMSRGAIKGPFTPRCSRPASNLEVTRRKVHYPARSPR
jgi:3-methyladenine DNA glycosylase AlkD